MDRGRISVRYARASYLLAQEKGEETRLYEEMKTLTESFFALSDLRRVLENPTITGEDKIKLLTTAAGGGNAQMASGRKDITDSYRRLIKLLVDNRRESFAFSIGLMYIVYYRQEKNILMTKLTMTEPPSEATKEKLKTLIKGQENSQVEFTTHVDPDIIGGFILRLNDHQLDASVKTQLSQLKEQLINVK